MKKIPSIFLRDWEGNKKNLTDQPNPECQWVFDNEGIATRKWDGTACMIQDGVLYKRYDAKVLPRPRFNQETMSVKHKQPAPPPEGFVPAQEPDYETGHWPGWLPVGNGPEDHAHRDGVKPDSPANCGLPDGTYELVGPKVQGNPENVETHRFYLHGNVQIADAPRSFAELQAFFLANSMEGIVFHHPDGRMAKVKSRDLGVAWPRK